MVTITSELWQKLRRARIARQQLQIFLEDFASLINDGLSVSRALATMVQFHRGSIRYIAEHVQQSLAAGQLIADGLRDFFPPHLVELIRLGELGGVLPASLASAIKGLQQQESVLNKAIASLIYPIAVLIAASLVAIFIRHTVLAVYLNIKPLSLWPSNGQHFYFVAQFLQYWGWLIPLILAAVWFMITMLLQNYVGQGRSVLDKLPIISLYRKIKAARLLETLGLLVANGMMLKQAFKLLQASATPYLASHLMIMEYRLGGGSDNIADVLDTGLVEKSDLYRLRAIARGRGFEPALIRQGQHAQEQAQRKINSFIQGLSYSLLMSGALFAAFMILAMYEVGAFISTY